MTGDLTIVAPRLKLRPTEPADAERFTEIQFNWNVIRMLRLANYPASLEAMTAWLAAHADERRAGTAFRFVVMFEDRVVGCADIDEIGAERGALGYWLDEAVWGRGLAVEAGSALMDWSFETLGLSGLDTGCASDNPASAAVLTRLGFQRAGEARLWSKPRADWILQLCFTRPAPGASGPAARRAGTPYSRSSSW